MSATLDTMRWDRPEYQRISSVILEDDRLHICFEDGSEVSVETKHVLPPDAPAARWDDFTNNDYEIIVPTDGDTIEIPWSTIRVLTDRDYSAHLADAAEEQARQIGLRIKELRKNRHLTSRELAKRAGITPQSLSRIEHGKHDVVYTTLQRLLSAMGYGLKDLIVAPVAHSVP